MTERKMDFGRDPAFDPFLCGAVGEDLRGANVTVLSMFARLGVDPWVEATDLAAMSEGPARKRLESLIARFKDVPSPVADHSRTASMLIARLPGRKSSGTTPAENADASTPILQMGPAVYAIIVMVLFLVWIVYLAQGQ